MTIFKILKIKWFLALAVALLVISLFGAAASFAAYNHMGDTDSINFRTAYPDKVGTKLDSCTLCHSGGSYIAGGKTVTLGSCQWCHYKYGYDASGDIMATLNQYGKDYLNHGRNSAAVLAIGGLDSDIDSYSNQAEIAALTYPGDPADNPSNVMAPFRLFTLKELEQMPQYSEFLLMNASKSDDSYTTYSGVIMEYLVNALKLDSATGITAVSPDGFATYHPFTPSANPNSYHVYGNYPAAVFHYNAQADMATNPSTGWCNYSAPSAAGRNNGDTIANPDGLKMLLAIKRDGQYLAPGVLNLSNKLDGEGPFRVVPPQKNPGPPDQRSTAANATDPNVWVWPYVAAADHNAGFSSRTVTMIRVEPLPPGTTDINTLEAGWPYVDENKIIIYGAINPYPVGKAISELNSLVSAIKSMDDSAFKTRGLKNALAVEVGLAKALVEKGAKIEESLDIPSHKPKVDKVKEKLAKAAYVEALKIISERVLQRTDGCITQGSIDKTDWVTSCDVQKQLYRAIYEISVILNIIK